MKILHIIPSLKKGGAERLCVDICNELALNGHDVRIVLFHNINDFTSFTANISIHIIPSYFIPSISGKAKQQTELLQQFIDNFQPHVIHLHLFEVLIVATCLTANAHWVIHFHDNMRQMNSWKWNTILSKQRLTNFYERCLVINFLKKQNRVTLIAISNDTLHFIHSHLPSWKSDTFLLHNAINLTRFTINNSLSSQSVIHCAMTGSLVLKKNQALAIQTIAELKKRGVSIYLHLLGDGPQKQYLKQLISSLSLEENVQIHGLIDHPEEILRGCQFYLHTARSEPFGLAILEAMACGLPVVCTDGKGNRGLINDGVNGFLVTKFDANLLADKVMLLIQDDNKRKQMGENARAFALKFDIKSYIKNLLSLYNRYDDRSLQNEV